jgi:peptidoglycan/xylan/chitin deacetylase (PgdA/CDA1 family)
VGGTNAWGGHPQLNIPTLPLLDWADLKDLKSRGASIEAHTNTHPNLPRLSGAEVDAELMQCRTALRERLGIESAHLAYPYGALNGGVVAHAARLFRFGYTTEFRALQTAVPPMQIPRLDMYYFQAPDALENWGSRAFAWRLASIRARRSIRARILPG